MGIVGWLTPDRPFRPIVVNQDIQASSSNSCAASSFWCSAGLRLMHSREAATELTLVKEASMCRCLLLRS